MSGPAKLSMRAAEAASPLQNAAEALVCALQAEDEGAVAAALSRLTSLEEQSLRPRLARLAQALHARVEALPRAVGAPLAGGDAAVHSLDHVVRLTEEAAHRSLDLVDRGQALLDVLAATGNRAETLEGLRAVFCELALAQGYQDLAGQIIGRVRALLEGVEVSLQVLAGEESPTAPRGPAVPQVDGAASTQSDADDLLAELGL